MHPQGGMEPETGAPRLRLDRHRSSFRGCTTGRTSPQEPQREGRRDKILGPPQAMGHRIRVLCQSDAPRHGAPHYTGPPRREPMGLGRRRRHDQARAVARAFRSPLVPLSPVRRESLIPRREGIVGLRLKRVCPAGDARPAQRPARGLIYLLKSFEGGHRCNGRGRGGGPTQEGRLRQWRQGPRPGGPGPVSARVTVCAHAPKKIPAAKAPCATRIARLRGTSTSKEERLKRPS